MDFRLTEEQKMVQQMAREFAENEMIPHAAEWEKNNEIPMELYRKMAESGEHLSVGAGRPDLRTAPHFGTRTAGAVYHAAFRWPAFPRDARFEHRFKERSVERRGGKPRSEMDEPLQGWRQGVDAGD